MTDVVDNESGPLKLSETAPDPAPPAPPVTVPTDQLVKYLTRMSFQVERSIKEMAELHSDITKQITLLEGATNHAS